MVAPFSLTWLKEVIAPAGDPSWTMFWAPKIPKGTVIMAGGAGDDFLAVGGLARGVPGDKVYAMDEAQLKDVVGGCAASSRSRSSSAPSRFRARFRSGKATIGLASQIGAGTLINQEAGKDIAQSAIPKEGSIGWVDGVMLVKGRRTARTRSRFSISSAGTSTTAR